MGIVKSGGIIVAVQESGETSRLARIFTEHYGLMKMIAKGARRPESRFGAATEPLTYIQGVYYLKEDSDIANLSAADIILPFNAIHDDLGKFTYGSGWAEVLGANLPYGQAQKRLYEAFLKALKDLDEIPKDQDEKFFWAHLLKFISLLGYRPEFLICSGCSVGRSDDWMFSVENGRLYCKKCSQSLRDSLFMRLDNAETRLLSIFINAEKNALMNLAVTEKQITVAREVIDAFRRYHTMPPGDLNALKFAEKVNRERAHPE